MIVSTLDDMHVRAGSLPFCSGETAWEQASWPSNMLAHDIMFSH